MNKSIINWLINWGSISWLITQLINDPYECLHMPTISAFLSRLTGPTQLWQGSWKQLSLKYQWVQVLRLRTNPWRVHEVKYLPPMKVAYSHTGFNDDQASYFSMKVLVFAEPRHIFLNHCWRELWPQVLSLQWPHRYQWLTALEPCIKTIRYVRHSQATSISYTVLVANYWSSTATLSYKSL